jgi:carbamoyl-phosphate synthase large subunit
MDKPELLPLAKKLDELGFKILATGRTFDMIAEAGIKAEKIKKLYEGRPNITDAMTNGKINLIINTPAGADSLHDDSYIRKAAIKYRIPYITTMAAAFASVEGIHAIREQADTLNVKSLQEFHKQITE